MNSKLKTRFGMSLHYFRNAVTSAVSVSSGFLTLHTVAMLCILLCCSKCRFFDFV